MDTNHNMKLLAELLQCGSSVYTWCYDADGNLLGSNCPDETFLASAFDLFGCREGMLAYSRHYRRPLILGTALGVLWASAYEYREDQLLRIWVIGPVFYQDVSMQGIRNGLACYQNLDTSVAWTHHLYEVLRGIPVMQNTIMDRYTLMLHYSLTGEHLLQSDINSDARMQIETRASTTGRDRHRIWMAEQALLQMVRTGDLNYQQALSTSSGLSSGVPVHSDDALRQSKTSVIVFTSLVVRAAIEGGLSPEESYALGDNYIQTMEQASTLGELGPLANMMYEDFIQRVHICRANPKLSRPIQKCVDYIEAHLDQKIHSEELASISGYTAYYLTHKFREETGLSVNDYIKNAKVERAKVLLRSTDQSVQDISAALCFSTRNYFSRVFQEITGVTPIEYREGKGSDGNPD